MNYILEIHDLGLVVRSPPLKPGVPLDTLERVAPMIDKGAVLSTGIATALGAVFAICLPENEAAWRAEVEKKYAHLPALEAWPHGTDTGISSKTIYSALSGRNVLGSWSPDVPQDPSDFGRCHRLLKLCPEWKGRLGEIVQKFPTARKWGPMAAAWPELEALYLDELPSGKCPKLYACMKQVMQETK